MATVAQLRARSHARVCYLLAIEGVPTMWTTDQEIVGTGGGSWIGTSYGARSVIGGLTLPDSVEFGIEDGMPVDGGAEFGLLDHDGTVSALFGNVNPGDVEYSEQRVAPTDDPVAATVVGFGDSINTWGRQIGVEAIGPAGQRRYWPCIPGIDLPGIDHASTSNDLAGYLAPVAITDDPYVLEGRRVALYRLHRDDDGSWPNWGDQYSGGGLVWWGTLRNLGSVDAGKNWRVRCDGPESWLRKTLNRNAPSEWFYCTPVFTLRTAAGEREDLIGCWFRKQSSSPGTVQVNDISLFDTANAITGTTEAAVRGDVNTVIQAVKSSGTTTFDADAPFGDAYYTTAGVLRIRIDTSASAYAGELYLVLHYKVWTLLGWDPISQSVVEGGEETDYDVVFRQLKQGEVITTNGASAPTPGPDYWLAKFSTRKIGATPGYASIDEQCNDEEWRYFRALTPGGVHVTDHLGGQQVRIGWDPIYLEGQLGRPPSDATINGSAATDTRWMLFSAPYRESKDTDPVDFFQVAKVSYRTSSGTMTQDAEGAYAFEIDRWEDPRHFGIPFPPLSRPWATAVEGEQVLKCLPLAVLRYSPEDVFDFAHHVLLRLLLSTGTASISGTEGADDPPTLTAGDNDHPDANGVHHFATDAEIADLGLAIPADLVDWDSFRLAADKLPGGWAGALNRCIVAWQGPMQAQDVISQILQARGWAMGLAGKRYSLFAQWTDLDVADASVTIGASDLHGDSRGGGVNPRIQIRAVAPVDRWTLQHTYNVAEGDWTSTDLRSRDVGVAARQGRIERTVHGLGLVTPALYKAEAGKKKPKPPPSWTNIAADMLATGASTFLAKPHQIVTVPVSRVKGQDLFPGDVVALTSTWPPDLAGGYGLTAHPARVVRARHYLGGPRHGCVELDLLVQGSTSDYLRRWAPVARVLDDVSTLEERYDAATRTFYCYSDAQGISDDKHVSDVKWFAEPAFAGVGGDALVYGYQYNGVTWSQTFSFIVSSVNTSTHTITHTVAGLTGTFYERMYTLLVLAPYDSQSADWPKAIFQVVTKANGKFGGSPTKGWRLGD